MLVLKVENFCWFEVVLNCSCMLLKFSDIHEQNTNYKQILVFECINSFIIAYKNCQKTLQDENRFLTLFFQLISLYS